MARLMAVSLTEASVVDETKDVTRRLGWKFAQPGDQLDLCRKVMGRRRPDGTVEPLVRLKRVELVKVGRVRLDSITDADVAREGVPDVLLHHDRNPWDTPSVMFVRFFCRSMKCAPDTMVTRLEWRYL